MLVHLVAVRLLPGFSRVVDLFLVVIVLHSLDGDTLAGLFGGLAAGLVQDAVTVGLYGLHGFAGTIVGYAAARASQLLMIRQVTVVGLLFILAAMLQQAVLVGLLLFFLPNPEIPSFSWLVAKSLGCGLVGVALFVTGQQLNPWVARWRRGRSSKVRLP